MIHPLLGIRLCTLLLGLGLVLPAPAHAGQATQKKKTTPKSSASSRAAAPARQAAKPAYSASASKARKARLARARAAARAREAARMRALKEAMTPRFKIDENGEQVPDVRAAAAIIFNPVTGQVLWEENAQDKRSIASITKVMTTLVFLEDNPDLTREVAVGAVDVYAASTTYLKAGDRLTLDEVLHLMLIASDNAAARVLARGVARRHRAVRGADEREGGRTRSREHARSPTPRGSTRRTSRRPTICRA